MTGDPGRIRVGASASPDPAEAAAELGRGVALDDPALTVFYCSPDYDLDALGAAICDELGTGNVIGCTTAGEISPLGYTRGTLTGVSFSKDVFTVATGLLPDLSEFALAKGRALTRSLIADLQRAAKVPTARSCFGFLLIDGLSMKEEPVVSGLYGAMEGMPLLGGSAGDGERFGSTFVYHGGRFHRDAAVFSLVHTTLPFEVFRTQHFIASEHKMVVTQADPARRLVTEINGVPAGREYARMVGLEVDKLTPLIFATHPVVVKIGGDYYVRSIQKVNEDESLTFFCAIAEGIVLTVAQGVDMIRNMDETFSQVSARIGEPQVVLGCDCILRHLELDRTQLKDRAAQILQRNNVVGFSTYGEQYNAMHVNQTFTGVAIGSGR